jgi:hypothetical protein
VLFLTKMSWARYGDFFTYSFGHPESKRFQI